MDKTLNKEISTYIEHIHKKIPFESLGIVIHTKSVDFITYEVNLMLFTDPHQVQCCLLSVNVSQGIVGVAIDKGFHLPTFAFFGTVLVLLKPLFFQREILNYKSKV